MRKVSIPRKFNKLLKEEAAHYRRALQLPDNNPAKRDIIHHWELEIIKQKNALQMDFDELRYCNINIT